LPNRFAINSARDVLDCLTAEQRRNATGELHHLDSAADIAARFGQRFAVLARIAPHNLVKIFLQQYFETEKYARARSTGGVSRQAGNAAAAACTASFTSVGVHIGVSAITSPVEGLCTGEVSILRSSCHSPFTKIGQSCDVLTRE
jgi:hypothetical protein